MKSLLAALLVVAGLLLGAPPTSATRSPPSMNADITAHLERTEAWLRRAPTEGLTEAQRQRRAALLDRLRGYHQAGVYPHNHAGVTRERVDAVAHGYETSADSSPVFIDPHGVHCAVGYLIAASGHGRLAREIAEAQNYAFVGEIVHPEFAAWAEMHGFSEAELAATQPGYPVVHEAPPPAAFGAGLLGLSAAGLTAQNLREARRDEARPLHVASGFAVGALSLGAGAYVASELATPRASSWTDMSPDDYSQVRPQMIGLSSVALAGGAISIAGASWMLHSQRRGPGTPPLALQLGPNGLMLSARW